MILSYSKGENMQNTVEMFEEFLNPTNIKVVGVGGAGCNAINRMIDSGLKGVEFIALNTDVQSLNTNKAQNKIQIGAQITRGLGSGANPELGEKAAFESKDSIKEALAGANMIFITAGMGGGTGTGAAPVVAEIAKELDILTVAVVTKPFHFEGASRMQKALEGINRFEGHIDSIITVSNEKLISSNSNDTTLSLLNAFEKVDDILMQGVQGIAEIINKTGVVNVDFADVKVIMNNAGTSIMGLGKASGKDRALVAAQNALKNPLLDIDIKGSKGILINVSGGRNLSLAEYHQIVEFITANAHKDANIIAGAYIDEQYEEELQVTLIATSFSPILKEEEKKIVENEKTNYIIDSKNNDLLEESLKKDMKEEQFIDNSSLSYQYDAFADQDDLVESRMYTKKDIYNFLDEDFLNLSSKLDIPTYQRKKI
jgi:cell division protein FtsZ